MVPFLKSHIRSFTRNPQCLLCFGWSSDRPNPTHLSHWCYLWSYRWCFRCGRRCFRHGTGPSNYSSHFLRCMVFRYRLGHGRWSGLVGRTPQYAKVLYGSYFHRLSPRNFFGLSQTSIRYYNGFKTRSSRHFYRYRHRY